MQPQPNLRHLNAAIEIHRLGNISRAAKRVHLSQSAVTQALAKLEYNLDTLLFTRSRSGLFATTAGTIYLRRAVRAVDWLKAIEGPLGKNSRKKSEPLHRRFTTTQLRALLAVVQHSNYTQAANQLEVSQPSVHRAVRELENVCGQNFFQRSPAGVEATWQARQIARYISLFFYELTQGVDEISEHKGKMNGSLRIGSLPLARTRILPHTVNLLLKEFPDARISIIDGPYNEQLHSLLHGQLDVIVGALREPRSSPDIVQEFLFEDPLYVVTRTGHTLLSSGKKLSAKVLQELDWIAPRKDTPAREAFQHFFENEGLQPPEHVIECSSLVAIRGLLMDSDRAALLSARQVAVDTDYGLLAISPQQLAGTGRDIGLAIRQQWSPTHVQARFLELLRKSNVDSSF